MKQAARRVRIHISGSYAMAPAQLMEAVMMDPLPNMFVRWRWVPAVKRTQPKRGEWNQEGAQRILHMDDGKRMLETSRSVRPGLGFTYELTDFTNAMGFFFTKIEDMWHFEDDGAGGSKVDWVWIMHARSHRGLLASLFASQWRGYMELIFSQSLQRLTSQQQ